ncbi:MAG TPA: MBL fold metallo-hydrolase [Methylomirabilota bacterium]|nr:MBL fold metallo-hydrolase [Methylomirabilota bacterium]
MPVKFTILASGSSGNCAYLEAGSTRLLIDAGLSGRQIRQRLLTIGRTPENLSGILVTHEHSDHVQGLATLAAKLQIPVYCNRLTRDAIAAQIAAPLDFRLFGTGASFEVGEVAVDSFSVPHDAYDPVGFLLHTAAGRLGFLTDLGHATKLVIERVRSAHVLVLEANHDLKLLQDDLKRPWSVKQRILSRHGHLSNEAAAQVAEQVVTADLRHLYLGHLSSDCNRPDLAYRAVSDSLHRVGARHVRVEAASQDVPCPTLELDDASTAAKAATPLARGEFPVPAGGPGPGLRSSCPAQFPLNQ